MIFSYIRREDELNKEVFFNRPEIEVELANGNSIARVHCIVDSGADLCFFHSDIAKQIGIQIDKGRTLNCQILYGSSFISYLHKVRLTVEGLKSVEIDVGFFEMKTRMGILGQHGFFENFIVDFQFSKKEFEIKAL